MKFPKATVFYQKQAGRAVFETQYARTAWKIFEEKMVFGENNFEKET